MKPAASKPGKTETLVSLVTMALLVVIAAGVLMRQAHFNPAVRVFVDGGGSEAPPAADEHPAPPAADLVALPALLHPMGPPETFGPDRLADKIDGKAPLYLSAGFRKLVSQRFALKDKPGRWFAFNRYRMRDPQAAFAVFSAQRRSDARRLAITRHSYATANALFVVHGPDYLELVGSGPGDALHEAMRRAAQAFVRSHHVAAAVREPGDLFPPGGLDPGSITLLAENAFGFAGLDRVTTALYRLDGKDLMAFVSRRGSARDAAELADAYLVFLKRFGAEDFSGKVPPGLPGARLVRVIDTWELVFTVGPVLTGVHEAPDAAAALALGRRLAAAIGEKGDTQ